MADQGLTDKRQKEVEQFGEELNEELRAAGISSAEQSFGLGCGLGLVPVSLLVLVLYFFNVVDLIPALVLLLLALLVLVSVASYMASQARIHRMDRYYQECIEPQIGEYLKRSQITRSQFNAYLFTCLADGAPLRDYLASENPNEVQLSEGMLEKKESI
jgi:hypothetical protein